MEKVNCDLCGYNEYEILGRRGRLRTPVMNVVCKNCGLVYVNPRINEREYRDFNLKSYRRVYKKLEKASDDFIRYQLYRGREIFQFLSGYVKPGGNVLDVGCTVGAVLEVFKQNLGCQAYGTEIANGLLQYANDKFQVMVSNVFFEDSIFPDNFFDIIIMSHILEHFYSPTKALQLARRILKDDGMIYIEVPNILRPYGRISSFFQIPHPYTFSYKTLYSLCKKVGLTIVKSESSNNIRVISIKGELCASKYAQDNDGHYLQILKRIRSYRIKYWLYIRYINFVREKFYWLKGKIGSLGFIRRYERPS